MTETNPGGPDTAQTDSGPSGADDDVQSDPAKGDEEAVDWSDETPFASAVMYGLSSRNFSNTVVQAG